MKDPERYWLSRSLFLRGLGFIYAVAFLILVLQGPALIGSGGLLPAKSYLDSLRLAAGGSQDLYMYVPTVFWLGCSDGTLRALSWLGLGLSLAAVAGVCNALLMAALWLVYMSFVHVGQVFYGYGWEMMLLEAGFLAIFLCPLRGWRPFPKDDPPPEPVFWLYRWMLFRVMFGAGMIKLRGDPCWRDLTCLLYHYETQPIPNPLSWYFHRLPAWAHEGGALANHVVELAVPWFFFGPRRARAWAAAATALFQATLILSGNLSFLNWLTLLLCAPCLDDGALARMLPLPLRRRLDGASEAPAAPPRWTPRRAAVHGLCAVVGLLSVRPALNLLSPTQAMNASFDPLGLVNTYGAFGSVGRRRMEVVLQGTSDPDPSAARWTDYEFKCKPGDPARRPCWVSPYHLRLDWQIWFAAMSGPAEHPWLFHLVAKLLRNDHLALGLLAGNPFPAAAPRYVRAELYAYRFSRPGDPAGAWWVRERVGRYLPPLSLDDPDLARILTAFGWR